MNNDQIKEMHSSFYADYEDISETEIEFVKHVIDKYRTMSQQDIRRELFGTEFWNEYCSQANCKGDRN